MPAHDFLDRLAGLVCVVERYSTNVVVQDVRFDDSVKDVSSDKAKVAIDSGRCSPSKVPYLRLVVRKSWVCVLEIRDGNYTIVFKDLSIPKDI